MINNFWIIYFKQGKLINFFHDLGSGFNNMLRMDILGNSLSRSVVLSCTMKQSCPGCRAGRSTQNRTVSRYDSELRAALKSE